MGSGTRASFLVITVLSTIGATVEVTVAAVGIVGLGSVDSFCTIIFCISTTFVDKSELVLTTGLFSFLVVVKFAEETVFRFEEEKSGTAVDLFGEDDMANIVS